MKKRIYLDNNASTAIDPKVLDIFCGDLKIYYGNPSSSHSFGQESRNRLAKARDLLADFLKVKPFEIIFTSGGTEGANMILRGFLDEKSKAHVISSSTEHSAVYGTLKHLEVCGKCSPTFLSPGLAGAVTLDQVRSSLKPDTSLIALMAANNETGVKTDIEAIAALAQEKSIPFFVDGVSILGKEPFTIPQGISAMCFSGHKLHAPKGTGFIFLRKGVKLSPLITGGNQENGRRAGTENVSGIIALGEAVRILGVELPKTSEKMKFLRDKLENTLVKGLPGVMVNGQGDRIPNTTNLSFAGVEGESLLASLDLEGVAVSHGSACASGGIEPSRILLNMGISPENARSAIRFSLSRFTTEEEIDTAIEIVMRVVQRLRQLIL